MVMACLYDNRLRLLFDDVSNPSYGLVVGHEVALSGASAARTAVG